MLKNRWNKYEIAWLIFAVILIITSIVYKHFNISNFSENAFVILASDFSAIFGVIYVICIAKQEKIAYLFGIANVLLYAIAVYDKGLYLSTAYNLFYSFPVMIYGYIYWSKLDSKGKNEVKEFSNKQRIFGILVMLFGIFAFAFISKEFFGGNDSLVDSTVSVCVCVATFLMARKYIEQWVLFVISNFMGIILFLPKSFSDVENIDLLVMWSVYFVNSIFGWVSWKKSLVKEREENA